MHTPPRAKQTHSRRLFKAKTANPAVQRHGLYGSGLAKASSGILEAANKDAFTTNTLSKQQALALEVVGCTKTIAHNPTVGYNNRNLFWIRFSYNRLNLCSSTPCCTKTLDTNLRANVQ